MVSSGANRTRPPPRPAAFVGAEFTVIAASPFIPPLKHFPGFASYLADEKWKVGALVETSE